MASTHFQSGNPEPQISLYLLLNCMAEGQLKASGHYGKKSNPSMGPGQHMCHAREVKPAFRNSTA